MKREKTFCPRLLLFICIMLLAKPSIFSTVLLLPNQHKNGMLAGTIVDLNDARVVSAKISLKNQNLNKELVSDLNGEFKIDLPMGLYLITVEADGFKKYQQDKIKIESEKTSMLKIMLEVASIGEGKCPPGEICL